MTKKNVSRVGRKDTSLTLDEKLLDEVYDEAHRLKIKKYEALEQALKMWLREVRKTGQVPRETMDAPGHLRPDLEVVRDAIIAAAAPSADANLKVHVKHIRDYIELFRQGDNDAT